ncbi:MAG: APC family permease [Nitrososphaerota archaeon]|nr:APC family permease [Nitrososphaerota archaeon]
MPNESKGSVFTRDSTGLVKSISSTDVLAFTFLAAGPIVLIALGVLTLPAIYEGANLYLIFGIAIVLLLALAYNTAALSSAMPRAGGDYVFGSRVIHPIWGMIPSFMILFSFVVGIGTLAVVSLEAFVGPAFITSYPQYLNTILSLIYTSPLNLTVIAAVVLVLIFGLAIGSTKGWFWFLRIVSIYSFVMILVFFGYLLTSNHQTILNNYDSQMATGLTTSQVIANATSAGWSSSVPATALTTAGAMIFVFFFLAAPIAAYFASEIKNTARSMTIGVLGGTVISWAIAMAGIIAVVGAFGYNFMSAYGFLGLINQATASTGAFNVNALVLAVVGNPEVAFLIGMGFALATLGLVAAPMLPASRILFAWSFDRLIPSKFASVSDRTHTPAFALSLVAVLTIIVAALDAYYSSVLGSFLATTLIVSIAFLPNGVTAALLPFNRKDVYEMAPSLVKKRVGRVPLLTLSGLVHAIGFFVLIVLVFLEPSAAGTSTGQLSTGALEIILVGLLISIAFYPLAKAIRKSSGIDLGLAFKEIPPE